MTSKSIIASAVLVAVAAVGYYVWSKPAFTPAPAIDSPPEPRELPQIPATTSVPAAQNTIDTDASEPISLEAAMEQNPAMEKVMGIWVRKDRDCTVRIEFYVTDENGIETPVHSCKPNNPQPVDIYNTYSVDELKELAYYDAKAAYKLSSYLIEENFPLATDYALRATALSGKGIYIASLVNTIPGSAFHPDGTENMEVVEYGYVLTGVAAAFDPSIDFHDKYARKAKRHVVDGIDMESLDARVSDMLEKIKSIRSEVGIN